MNFESWWLLALPLFFALGWFASRLDLRSVATPRTSQLPDAYFKGLNFLLNEQSDKAVDAFVDVVRLEPETIELHFALGNLFRRRGEYDRAIRVHQNLLERGVITPEQKEHALFEVGQDYLKAGLLDRAEDSFNRLSEGSYASAALKHRLAMAQMVSDWPQAIKLALQLMKSGASPMPLGAQVSGENYARELCHFYCESRHVDEALAISPTHPRPLLLQATELAKKGDARAALRIWKTLIISQPEFLGLFAYEWMQAHRSLDPSSREGYLALEPSLVTHFSSEVFKVVYQARQALDGHESALAWAKPVIAQSASLGALKEVLQDAGDSQNWLTSLVSTHAEPKTRYVCKQCGFQAKQYYWRCQGCNRWDSYPPRLI